MPTRKTLKISSEKSAIKASVKSLPKFNNFQLKKLILPAIVVVVVLLLVNFKNQFIVATVNGQPVSRLELIKELEKKDGKSILENLVTEKLIFQEATKRKIEVSDSEIKVETANIEQGIKAQGESLDSLLTQQNMTRDDLTKQVKIQLLLKKMVGGNIQVTDKEINDYLEQNKQSVPAGTDPATLKPQIKQQLEQQKLNEKIQTFVADIQKKAKIEYLLKF